MLRDERDSEDALKKEKEAAVGCSLLLHLFL